MKFEPFLMTEYMDRLGHDCAFDLTGSTCEVWRTDDLLALDGADVASTLSTALDYAPTNGGSELRSAIAALYEHLSGDDIIVTNGGAEGIFLTMSGLLSPGDHAVVHTPCFQPLLSVARATGAEVTEWQALESENWIPSIERLQGMLTDNTRVVVINSPHNPSGVILEEDFLTKINAIARERGFVVICDEIFRWSEREESRRAPAIADMDTRAISLGALSKSFGLPGTRIGWLVVRDPALRTRIYSPKVYTTRNMNPVSILLANVALRHTDEILERNRRILLENGTKLDEFVTRSANQVNRVGGEATPVIFLDLLGRNAEDFCARAAEHADLALIPGTMFGDCPSHIRVGYGTSGFEASIERLEQFLAENG